MTYIIEDKSGDNSVDSVTKKMDVDGRYFYEFRGKNSLGEERIVRLYNNDIMEYFIVQNAQEIKAHKAGIVHLQILKHMPEILAHFDFSAPLVFNEELKNTVPQRPPAFPQSKRLGDAELPNKSFFVQAAQRAMKLGDVVSSQQHIKAVTRNAIIGKGAKFYDEGDSTRLNLFNLLVLGKKDGYYPYAATTAYGLSILTYIALHYDKLVDHIKTLYSLYQTIAGDIPSIGLKPDSEEYRRALAKGLKAEVNEITYLRETAAYGLDIDDVLDQYTHDLVQGNALGRCIIDKNTKLFLGNYPENETKRIIPAFFPIPLNSDSTHQIVLQAGGCKTHSAIICIWKQGVDAMGYPVPEDQLDRVVRYRVYRTVCNAGFGTTYKVDGSLYHETCTVNQDGKTYSVCTQEVLLDDENYSHHAMQMKIKTLIDTERQLLLKYNLPGNGGPNGEAGSSNASKNREWRRLNRSIRLGPLIESLSALTSPQKTGNCTVRSIQEYLRWELLRMGITPQDAELILDEHWNFSRMNDSKSIASSLSHSEEGESEHMMSPKPKQSLAVPLHSMNIVNVKEFFEHPVIPPFPEFYADDDDAGQKEASLINSIKAGKIPCPKPKMMKLEELLVELPKDFINAQEPQKLGYHILYGCDSRKVALFPCMNGSVRQDASQFDCGESKGRYLTPPSLFKKDPTQGPAEQRTSGGAAIARYVHAKDCNFFGVLLSFPDLKQQFDDCFDYQFGYLTPKEGKEKEGLAFLKDYINQLVLNVERVAIDRVPGQTVIQVLNAALALGGYDIYPRTPENQKYLDEMMALVLEAQYEAVAAVAILEARNNPSKRIPVSFTLVGGGAFGNKPEVIAKAFCKAIERINTSGLGNMDICLSIWSQYELERYKTLATNGGDAYAHLNKMFLENNLITEKQLQHMKAFPVSHKISALDNHCGMNLSDKETEVKFPEVHPHGNKKTMVLSAMQTAISSMSKKWHLGSEEREKKAKLLQEIQNNYKKAQDGAVALSQLKEFVLQASKERKSSWSPLFTSRFGETASMDAFFKQMNTSELKELLRQATSIDPASNSKDFAAALRKTFVAP